MTAAVLIASVACAIWGAVFLRRGSLLMGCLAYIMAACCFGHPFWHYSLGPLPLTLDRLLLAFLVVTFLVQSRLGRTDSKPLGWTDAGLLLLTGLLAASTFAHDWNAPGPADSSPAWRLVFAYLMPLALYWVARQSKLSAGGIDRVHACLACFGIYLAVTGLAEIAHQWWLVFPGYIADPSVGIHFGRARGPMVQAGAYGACLSICLMAAWMWRQKLGRPAQLGWFLLLPVFLLAIYFCYTRSVWGGTALGLLVILGLTLQGRWRGAVLGSLVVVGLSAGVTRWDRLLNLEREHSAAEARESGNIRVSFAYVSWLMFQDRPLLGCGFGQFSHEVLPYLADRSTHLNLESMRGFVHHNALLCILVENGLLGLLLFSAVLAGWGRTAWMLWRSGSVPDWARRQAVLFLATLALYLVQAVSHDITYTGTENMLLFFLAGLTMGLRPLIPVSAQRVISRHALASGSSGHRGLAPSG